MVASSAVANLCLIPETVEGGERGWRGEVAAEGQRREGDREGAERGAEG